jgi:hypothetical protein
MADRYLLIEHHGPWRFDALAGAGWSAETVAALTAAVRESGGRLLMIRRPGRRSPGPDRAWAVTRVGVGTRWGRWSVEHDLLDAATTMRMFDTAGPAPSADPLLLVCAHGVHDTCCALRGRPVASRLARHWPAATWECSHVGGDRFAANVVVLPDGTYYGGLDADSAPPVITAHLGGRLDVAHLRGSVRWPPAAQVAVGEMHRRFGPYAADDVRVEGWTAHGPHRWRVQVSVVGDQHRVVHCVVEVTAEQRTPTVLTCAATRATTSADYRVTSVRPI